nr:leucine-rich repeat and IQ domain-containing protein 3 isoform X1 [Misgurnus anguillicaudatus]
MDSLKAYWTYLVSCSQSLILDHGYWKSKDEKAMCLHDIVMVKLSRLLLKNLDQIGCCRSLRICILADNFLTRIEAVMACTHLVKLDLKGNQIVQLPDASCWSQLKELQLLYLHDNNMATWDDINGLSGCLNLTALTLFDTPLSLKKNYRHCVVNNIWSLKALDNYVISDEEIIQNWSLSFQFKAMKQHFHVNLYSSKPDSFETELKAVYKLIAEINRIQAFCCPTLIIQRWIRGYLIRKHLGISLCGKKRTWPEKSFISTQPVHAEKEQVSPQSQEIMEEDNNNHCVSEKTDVHIKRLNVDLNKLMQAGYSEVSFEATNAKPSDSQKDTNSPYITSQPLKSELNASNQDAKVTGNEDIKKTAFRVLGMKVHQTVPSSNTLTSRNAMAQEIRDTIRHLHTQRPGPQPHSPAITSVKHLIGHCHGTISFTTFRVIDKAHRASEKAEMQRHLAENVTEQQFDREVAKSHRDDFMEARRTEARLRQKSDQVDIDKTLSLQRAKRDEDIQQARQKHAQFVEDKRRKVREQEMVYSFSRQHNSIARVVFRYNRTKKHGNQQEKHDHAA